MQSAATNSASSHNGSSDSRPETASSSSSSSRLYDHDPERASAATGESQREETDGGVARWQFWTYGRQNLSIVHTTIVPEQEADATATTTATTTAPVVVPIQDHERTFVVKAIGANHSQSPPLAFATWTCAASFGDALIIGTKSGALLNLSLEAVHTRSVAEVVLRGQITEVNNKRGPPTERRCLFDSAVVALSESNHGWLVVRGPAVTFFLAGVLL